MITEDGGRLLSDYKLIMEYDLETGWGEAFWLSQSETPPWLTDVQIQEVFQEVHIYRSQAGYLQMFGCKDAVRKINTLCRLFGLPPMDEERYIECLKAAVTAVKSCMPPEEDAYLNAYTSIVQTQPSRSHAAGRTFFRILFSAARTQDSPYSLYAESDQMRCLRGGGHMMNTSGCRSAVLPSLKKAQSLGYDDVLWIAGDSQLLEQTCQANVFVAVDHRIITPPAPLGGAVRSDFMRDCVLDLLKQEGNHVEERVILGQDLMEAVRGGRPLELFLAGTECGIRLVTSLCYQGSWYQIPVPSKSLACQLQQTIRGIQQDRLPDPFRWLTYVDKH